MKDVLAALVGRPYATKAEGPIVNAIGEIEPALIERALVELGDPDAWPASARDQLPGLRGGRSLILRTEEHRDTRRRKNLPAINEIVDRVCGLGYGRHPGKIMAAYLPPGGTIAAHWDSAQYYRFHNRIHVPLRTNPGVVMTNGDTSYRMEVGKIYLYQNLLPHSVVNQSGEGRIHLILDVLDPRYAPIAVTRLYPVMRRNLLGAASLYRAWTFVRHSSRR